MTAEILTFKSKVATENDERQQLMSEVQELLAGYKSLTAVAKKTGGIADTCLIYANAILANGPADDIEDLRVHVRELANLNSGLVELYGDEGDKTA